MACTAFQWAGNAECRRRGVVPISQTGSRLDGSRMIIFETLQAYDRAPSFWRCLSLEWANIDIKRTLYEEVEFAHGAEARRDRRPAIPDIVRKLRCTARARSLTNLEKGFSRLR